MRICTYLLAITLFLALPFTAKSQVSGDISATATVLEALSVTGVNDLEFGNIVAGQTHSVSPEDAEAGSFLVNGEVGAEVDLSFTLPGTLELMIDPSQTLDISFGSDDAILNTDFDPAGGTNFDPESGTVSTLSAVTGELFVFIGGEVSASMGQIPGDYEGLIVITIDYTGN